MKNLNTKGLESNHCSKTFSDCRVVSNSDLNLHDSITLEFNLHFKDNSLVFDDSKETTPNKRQIVLYKLITFMNKEKGMSYRKICAWFNKSGIKTHKGRTWSETGSHAHMIVKRMKQREHRLNVIRKQKTDSQITDFKIGGNHE